MCGIVAGISQRNVLPILLEGLKRLEYRGYDSCGIAFFDPDHSDLLVRLRSVTRVSELQDQVDTQKLSSVTGIAHTRWATHGAPATHNAHPHLSFDRQNRPRLAIVHNGIIENYEELRQELQGLGYEFHSQTDSEVIAHLINHYYDHDVFEALKRCTTRLKGAYALAVFSRDEPNRVVGARHGSPLVLGIGDGEYFMASDALALAGTTDQIIYLEDGDLVDMQLGGYWVTNLAGESLTREVNTVHIHTGAADLGPYRHYMQKEIFEQARAISDTLADVGNISPELFGDQAFRLLKDIDSVLILACGTSYYAGQTAKYWIESVAGIPVNVEIASEYRYRVSVPNPKQLVVTISQSGETADTLAALRHARHLGMEKTLTICNVATSAMVRECQLAFITRAGVEIGVASTKAFTTQLVALFLLSLVLAQIKGKLSETQEADYLKSLRHLPMATQAVLALEPQIIAWSEAFARKEHALFLGRGMHYPIAMEGALKLKEISYIHAEAYPAGELKHGPLALVTDQIPVVVVAPNDELLEKLKSNMQEVRARGGELYVFADSNSNIRNEEGMHVILLPEHYGLLSPVLHTLPLQLLAYHTAVARGTDVDKPRNLAKSVTVE